MPGNEVRRRGGFLAESNPAGPAPPEKFDARQGIPHRLLPHNNVVGRRNWNTVRPGLTQL